LSGMVTKPKEKGSEFIFDYLFLYIKGQIGKS
jgi:hypothetical protein